MPMYLKITDGTTTFDLLGGDAVNGFNLEAEKWAPNVAERLPNGNISDVLEEISLYVSSTSDADTVLANIDALAKLIDQAARWAKGEANVAPVLIQYSPNSASVYLEAAILGPPEGAGGVALPSSFVDKLYQNVVDSVVLQFRRRGRWLGPEETATPVTGENSRVITAAFSAAADGDLALVDVDVTIDQVQSSNSNEYVPKSFVLFSAADGFVNYAASVHSSSSGYSSQAESGTGASGNTLLRFTPTDTSEKFTNGKSETIERGLVAFYMNVRSSIAGVSWGLKGRLGNLVSRYVTTQKWINGSDVLEPTWVFVGLMSVPVDDITFSSFSVQASTTSGSPVLDIERVCFHRLDLFSSSLSIGLFDPITLPITGLTVLIRHNKLDKPLPSVQIDQNISSTSNLAPLTSKGVPIILNADTDIDMVWLATRPPYWRWYNQVGGSVNPLNELVEHEITATRRPAYLVPQ